MGFFILDSRSADLNLHYGEEEKKEVVRNGEHRPNRAAI